MAGRRGDEELTVFSLKYCFTFKTTIFTTQIILENPGFYNYLELLKRTEKNEELRDEVWTKKRVITIYTVLEFFKSVLPFLQVGDLGFRLWGR